MLEQLLSYFSEEDMKSLLNVGLNILYAIIILIIGFRVIRFMIKVLKRRLFKAMKNEDVSSFMANAIAFLLKVSLIIAVASMLGVQTASFIAILGSVGLAIGLSLQGSLTNIAGGILILILKPFIKGEFVTIQGHDGFVEEINLLTTTLRTRLNRLVTIPNGVVSNNIISNHFREEKVRKKFNIGISYNSDIRTAKKIVMETALKSQNVESDPPPFVEVMDLADSAVILRIFVWVKPKGYFGVVEPLIENIVYAFEENGIEIPFPQRVVHMHNDDED